jgi:predicted component of type VI protein secretion system
MRIRFVFAAGVMLLLAACQSNNQYSDPIVIEAIRLQNEGK